MNIRFIARSYQFCLLDLGLLPTAFGLAALSSPDPCKYFLLLGDGLTLESCGLSCELGLILDILREPFLVGSDRVVFRTHDLD